MKLVRQGEAWVERYDHGFCPHCLADWTPGRGGFGLGWLPCECTPGERGHRILKCKSCPSEVLEPDHTPQVGPTADYGGISTHRPSS